MRFVVFLAIPLLWLVCCGSAFSQSGFVDPDISLTVGRVLIQPDGKIVVAGAFQNIAGVSRRFIGRLNSDGTLDPSFDMPQITDGPYPSIFAVALQSDSKILIGGTFASVGGIQQAYLARLNSNGTVDASFRPSVSGSVLSIAIQPDRKVLVGGEFLSAEGQPRTRLARFNEDGSLDTSFGDTRLSDYPGVIVVQPDSKILVGGDFDSINGETRSRLTRLNSNGSTDTSFSVTLNGPVANVRIQADGKIVVCGYFNQVNGLSRTTLARLNSDGSLDPSLINVAIPSGAVTVLAIQPDGKFVVGGTFALISGGERRGLARLNPNGELDERFVDANANTDGRYSDIQAIEIQNDLKILVGGGFNMIGRQSRKNLVRLNSDGSLDLPPGQTLTVTKIADTNDGVCDSDCSFREAVAAVAPLAVPSQINFSTPYFDVPRTITLNSEISINSQERVTIRGPGSNLPTLSGNNATRIFEVIRPVIISGLTLTQGNGFGAFQASEGGAILARSSELTLVSVVISNNFAASGGGAIRMINPGNLVISDSSISGNRASGIGGALWVANGTANIVNTNIINNEATGINGFGGGIYGGAGVIGVSNSVISNNRAVSGGGLITTGLTNLNTVIVSGNTASNLGGGINCTGSTAINDSTISGNTAAFGGGIFSSGGVTADRSSLNNNQASTSGGGIYNNAGGTSGNPTIFTNSIISGNTATSFGGGIYNRDRFIVDKSTVTGNFATMGAGGAFNVFLNVGADSLTVTDSTFNLNRTNAAGGGLANQGGTVTIINSTFSRNDARGTGGGVQTNSNGTTAIDHSTIAFNTANAGGGTNANGGTIGVRKSIIARNQAGVPLTNSDLGGAIASSGYNLFMAPGNAMISGSITGNILGIDPLLDQDLGANGGPTLTHKLLDGSPAIDAAAASSPALITDQRERLRIFDFVSVPNAVGGDGSDIGALEVQADDLAGNTFVSVSGRVSSPAGIALRNVFVSLTGPDGVRQTATTSSFGVFTFSSITNNRTYTLTAASKRYRFSPQILSIQANVSNIELIGLE